MSNYYNRQWRLPNNENKDKQSNYSMDFDGSSQYIDLGNISSLNFERTDAFSISAWVKRVGSGTTQFIFSKATNSSPYTGYSIYINPSNQIASNINILYSSNHLSVNGNSTLNTSWNHVCVTYDGSSNASGIKLYVNGSEETTSSTGQASITGTLSNSHPVNIGARNSSDLFFEGQLDGVSIFNYALSASQVTTLYGSSSTGIGNPMSLSPKPVAYYPLGDQDAFNGASYLTPNSSLKDFVFSFDGGDYIDCGNDSSLNVSTSNHSFSFWLKTTTTSNEVIAQKGNGDELDTQTRPIGSGNVAISWAGFNGYDGTTVINDGNWHNIIFIANGSVSYIYVDGNLDVTGGNKIQSSSNSDSFYIGSRAGLYGFNGSLSNAQVFNTALPATGSNSVETLYNNGSPLTSMTGFSSLVGWWKLDASATYDSSTTTWTIEDSSTNSNTGTSSGMTQSALQQSDLSFKTSISPFALNFDTASSDFITVGGASGIATTDSSSLSIWFTTTTTSSFRGLFGTDTTSLNFYSSIISTKNSGGSAVKIQVYLSPTYYQVTPVINDGNWHHLTFVYDHSASLFKAYTDGIETYSATYSQASTGMNLKYIGTTAYSGGAHSKWDGKLSNTSIWNTALTSAQVSEIYNEGVPSNLNNHSAYSNLVSWWQLGSNSSFNTNWTVLDVPLFVPFSSNTVQLGRCYCGRSRKLCQWIKFWNGWR